MKKKLTVWLMLLCLGLLLIPSVFAGTEGTCGENLSWMLEDGLLTISGTGEMEDYEAGTTPWYESRSEITGVEILDGVTYVGQEAFMDIGGLKSVTISGSVKTVGMRAFSGCSRLTAVILRQGTEVLGSAAFESCGSLKTVTIPASVTEIGSFAFADCSSIESVYYGGSEEDWNKISVGTNNDDFTAAEIQYNGANCDHSWDDGTVTSAASCTEAGVKTCVCQLCGKQNTVSTGFAEHTYESSVVEPQCTAQGYTLYTCKNCGDTYKDSYVSSTGHDYDLSVTDPTCEAQGYTTYTCSNCGDRYKDDYVSELEHNWDDGTVTLEPTQESDGELKQTCLRCGEIRYQALPYSTWRLLDGELTILAPGAMENYSADNKAPWNQQREEIISVVLCEGVTAIGDYAFYGLNQLTQVTIPEGVKSIGTLAFAECSNLESITLPEGLTEIGEEAFAGSGLKSVTIPGTVVSVGTGAFSQCARLETATMLQGTQIIGERVFEGCNKLSAVSVPASVTQIGQDAFGESSVADIYYGSSETAWLAIQMRSGNDSLNAAQVHYNGVNCNHSYDNGTVTSLSTCSQNGVKIYICGLCGNEKQEMLEKTQHQYTEKVTSPDCVSGGYTTHTCQSCGNCYQDAETAPLGHDYEGRVTEPSCTEKGYTAYVCQNCGDSYQDDYTEAKGHRWSEGTETKAATCTVQGIKTYTCQSCKETREETIEKTAHVYEKTVTPASCEQQGYTTCICKNCGDRYREDYVDATGHDFAHTTIAPSCTEGGYTVHTCKNCEYGYSDTYTGATGHSWNQGQVTREATCEKSGVLTYTCQSCGEEKTEMIPAVGHSFDAGTVTREATCTATGIMTYCCKDCDLSYTESIAQKEHEDQAVVTEATCTEMGYTTYTCRCCRRTYRDAYVSARGHSYEEKQILPTCTERGYTLHSCKVCGRSYKDTYQEPTGHSWDSGRVTTEATCEETGMKTYACQTCGETKTETIEATGHDYESKVVKATCTEKGCTLHTCKNCEDGYRDTYTNATGHSWNDGVITKAPTVTEQGEKTYTCQTCGEIKTEAIATLSCPFTDLANPSSYYDAVLWAVDKGITKGTSDTEFSPKADCTRAQIVTFLWRYAGEPEPTATEHNFVDLVEDSSYYKAVLWAVEKGITNGIDKTHFGPKETCTRAQIVTFLWRAAGEPEPTTTNHNFVDLVEDSSYYKAVLWAVEKGITTGADATHFNPKATCTRAQGMTFLWRYNNNK